MYQAEPAMEFHASALFSSKTLAAQFRQITSTLLLLATENKSRAIRGEVDMGRPSGELHVDEQQVRAMFID